MSAQAVRLSNVDIDNALKSNDFEVLFQPIFDLSNGALARVETFVRWRHASLGVLPPGAFISFFETQGRMSELTRYVLGEALERYKQWRGPYPPGFSINLALSDLGDPSFVSHFNVLLREHDFPADLVTLECPMPPVDQDVAQAAENFERLAETGARLAIEVRGRTNEFLHKIDPFPFAEIKTGGAAILRFARTVRGPGLSAISELLELAQTANAVITAVGVEDQASLSALRSIGFAAAQGNHLGRVGSLEDFKPSHVNGVRELLELPPLSKNDLGAMFRSTTPEVVQQNAAPSDTPAAEHPAQKESPAEPARSLRKSPVKKAAATATRQGAGPAEADGLIERLAARIADNEAAAGGAADTQVDMTAVSENQRRAAAIAQARQKAGQKVQTRYRPVKTLREEAEQNLAAAIEETETPSIASKPEAGSDIDARDLQARLSEEYPMAEDAVSVAPPEDDAPSAVVTPITPAAEENAALDKTSSDEVKPEASTQIAPHEEVAADPTSIAQKAALSENTPAQDKSKSDGPSEFVNVDDENAEDAAPAATATVREETAATAEKTPSINEPEPQEDAPQPETTRRAAQEGDNAEAPSPESPYPSTTKLNLGPASVRALSVIAIGAQQPSSSAPQPRRQAAGAIPEITIEDPADILGIPPTQEPQAPAALAPVTTVLDAPSDEKISDDNASAEAISNIEFEAPALDESVEEALDIEAGMIADALDETTPAPRKRRKKNILMRKYKLPAWPSHFWPHSWRQAWRRRAAYKEAMHQEENDLYAADD